MKLILYRVLFTCMLVLSVAFGISIKELSTATDKQKIVLYNAYSIGSELELKHYGSKDLEYIMAAIAWHESGAGLDIENGISYGVFQINLSTASTRAKRLNLGLTKQELKNLLMEDMYFSGSFAEMELKDWDRVHKGDIKKIIASYNGGYSWRNTMGYANMILSSAKYFKETGYFSKNFDLNGFIINDDKHN